MSDPESAPGRGNVVARVQGSEPDLPAVLVHGHLDVVPADVADWTVDPFAGEITHEAIGEVLWGRGAVGMKNMVAMMLATARAGDRTGRRPHPDVVFAFTADEEDAGTGAAYLTEKHAGLSRRQRPRSSTAGCSRGRWTSSRRPSTG